MAEEDILFGKNRHLFGGIQPSDMRSFHLAQRHLVDEGRNVVEITMQMPYDTIIDNQTLCSVGGVVVRKSTTGYPKNEFDGELLQDYNTVTANKITIIDKDVVAGQRYYYGAFPYSVQGVYNKSRGLHNLAYIDVTVEPPHEYYFGYDIDLDNPSTTPINGRVSYPSDVDNANYAPAYMDYTADSFNYGGWTMNPGEKFMPRPCTIPVNGSSVYEYLNPNDYSKNVDGNTSQIENMSYNSFMEWPKIWTKRWEENGVYHFRCSDVQLDPEYECWCNYDKNNNQIDHFYTSIYTGVISTSSGYTNKLYSNRVRYANYSVYPYSSTWTNLRNICEYSDGLDIGCLSDWLLIQDLLVMMAKTTDCQSAYGQGYSPTSGTADLRGQLDQNGLFWGDDGNSSQVKVFGMEDWWGNGYKYLTGYLLSVASTKNTVLAKYTRGKKDGSTVSDYNLTGNGYINTNISYTQQLYYTYISGTQTLPIGRIPTAASGSSSTYEADVVNIPKPNSTSSIRVARVGGYTTTAGNGPFQVSFDDSGTSSQYATLSYKPTKS